GRISRSFSGWGRLTTSPRLATAALSAAAFGFAWHGARGGSASPRGGETRAADIASMSATATVRAFITEPPSSDVHVLIVRPAVLAGVIESFVVAVVSSVTTSQEVIDHEIRDVAAQPLSSGEVEAEVGSGENPAQRRLFRSSRESLEWARDPWHDFRGDVKVELILLQDGDQHR